MKLPIQPSSVCSLHREIDDGSVVGFNVGPSGEVCFVVALNPLDDRSEGFMKLVPASPQRHRILMVRAGEVELDLIIDSMPLNIHDIQPLDDSLLLACARSEYRGPDDFDRNARVYSRDGMFLREFLLGDGIEAIQATRRGELWVSYFDEGVFGNHGWRDPVGASGLVAWGSAGEKIYEYEPTAAVGPIIDCYALNVATDEDVWCYYYTGFPLVHLHEKRIASTWNIPVAGSRAFAVGAGHALFAGGYKDRDTFVLVRLGTDGEVVQIGQFELREAEGDVVKVERVAGRGSSLYVLSENILYEVELRELTRVRASRRG